MLCSKCPDLTPSEMSQIAPGAYRGVYALVKQNMSDAALSQPPLLLIPENYRVPTPFPPQGSNNHKHECVALRVVGVSSFYFHSFLSCPHHILISVPQRFM